VGRWIAGCAASGFNAVEIDNLDTFTRSFKRGSSGATYLSKDDAKRYATLLTAAAHANGLAVAQKNTLELEADADGDVTEPDAGRQVGFDFGIVEECGQFSECGSFFEVWGSAMFIIEYSDANFRKACNVMRRKASVVRRDVQVSTPSSSSYRYNAC
jgi:Glycoside-hydrolase family GH114